MTLTSIACGAAPRVAEPPSTVTRSRVVAHRGASADAPENTLAAFRAAWALGVEAVELDVRLSRDDAPPGEQASFLPSFARTSTGRTIRAEALMTDDYCADCHQDVHRGWLSSAHRFSSFNNPVYAALLLAVAQVHGYTGFGGERHEG